MYVRALLICPALSISFKVNCFAVDTLFGDRYNNIVQCRMIQADCLVFYKQI